MESKVITVGRNEYKVHPEGLIESRHRMLRPQDNSKGYKYVCLGYGEGGYKNFYIHRLVAEAFIDNPLNLPEINHIDGNRANNMVSNLEWCDRVYNVRDYVSKGRGKYSTKSVKQIDEQGTTIKTWLSLKEASKDLGCTPELLGMAANGRIKKAKGFLIRFSDETILA